MFQTIFERSDNTNQLQNFARLTEELGELSEAVRTLPLTRSYFLSEAADVFAWLVGVSNQMEANNIGNWGSKSSLAEILWEEYPGRCRHCGSPSCKCAPLIPESRGRIAHLGPRHLNETGLFTTGESMEFFRIGDSWLFLREQQIAVTSDFIREIRLIGTQLLNNAAQVAIGHSEEMAELSRIGTKLAEVDEAQLSLQEAIEDADRTIARMPLDVRTALSGFLVALGAGAWLQVAVTYGPSLFH